MDHKLAVKEYRKAAADQGVQLSSHLRPLPILKKTIDYLVTKVVGQSEQLNATKKKAWHNFLWDRFRSIMQVGNLRKKKKIRHERNRKKKRE